jgi:hypothetical protein
MSLREPDFNCAQSVDAAPYVLGALEDEERYLEHLATCATCRAEVEQLRLVVDTLPLTVPPVIAPEGLRERVLATVRAEAELLRAAGHEADAPPRPANRRRLRRAAWVTSAVALAASAVVAIAITTGGGSPPQVRVTPAQVAATAPDAHAALRQSSDRAELVVSKMPPPPLGKVYEVWLGHATGPPQPTDALFSVTSRGSGSVDVPGDLRGVKEILVTSEPLGGSSHPTSPPLIRVALST